MILPDKSFSRLAPPFEGVHTMAMNPSLRNRLPLYPSQFIAGFVVVSLGPLLDSMMRDLGIPLSRGGLISLAFFAGQVVGIIVLNLGMARIPAKQALILGALLQAVSLIVAGLVSSSLGSLLAAWWVAGLGWALFNTIGWMWVPVHVKQGTAAAILLMTLFYALGNMLGPLVLGSLLGSGSTWRWILAGEGMVTLAFALAFTVLPFLDVPAARSWRFVSRTTGSGLQPGFTDEHAASCLPLRWRRDQFECLAAEVPDRHLSRQ